jgi:formylglycine-generating enzyme required for sulfatase activity
MLRTVSFLSWLLVISPLHLAGQSAPPDATSNMVSIPAGEFWMGRTYLTPNDALDWWERDRVDDRPVHLVYVDSFYLDKTEVTNEDYARFVQAAKHRTPYHWIGGTFEKGKEKYPIYNVSWDDAVAFCTWAGKRLPTEAEWERAARSGLDRKNFSWGDDLDLDGERAHFRGNNGPKAVASYPPNAFGVYDMLGNVNEWIADWWHRNYYSISPDRNPKGPDAGEGKVVRGGGWSTSAYRLMPVYNRNWLPPSTITPSLGFRCAKDAK